MNSVKCFMLENEKNKNIKNKNVATHTQPKFLILN